ncbi:hypothetical protein HU200_032347 [Digitaria exilis]|uniref:Uncharacterized protein n=1 Tax=Digitaria exilis TaxID=1010633 RepID=A0A835BNU8_9POAL|nr:hypothetical protein HU200_032347 [Digitaria exilis]
MANGDAITTATKLIGVAVGSGASAFFTVGASSWNTIDDWLRENRMRCPVCCKIAYLVLPWRAPPTSPPPGTSACAVAVDDGFGGSTTAVVGDGFGGSGIAAVGDGGGATSSSTAVAATDAVVAVVQGYITVTVTITSQPPSQSPSQ